MGRFFYTYKFHIVRALFSLLLLLVCGSAWADDNCPTLETKHLSLCNPSKEEVTDYLEAPVKLINGERAEGYLTLDKNFYYTKNNTEYTAIWTFKNDEGTVLADGCEQKFYVQDTEDPIAGATTLNVYGFGTRIDKEGLKTQISSQPVTWSDNCTVTDSLTVDFHNFSHITKSTYGNNESVVVRITLTDKNGNNVSYDQTVKIIIDNSDHICPYIKDIVILGCDISCDNYKNQIQSNLKQNTPKMDAVSLNTNVNIEPEKSRNNYNLFANGSGSTYNCNGPIKPGEYTIYLKFKQMSDLGLIEWWHKYCPQKVIVKDAGTPPDCPELKTLSKDVTTISASEIESLIANKVHTYGTQLDNCSPNANLEVSYKGANLEAPFCGVVTYSISDYGTKRSCKATIALPECPNLPQRTKKFCPNDGLGKDELVTFMNSAKPTLQFCDEAIQGTLSTDGLSDKYTSATTLTVKWNFYKDGEIVKTCTQSVVLQEDYNMTCTASDFELEAKENCAANGSAITVPVLNGCYNKYWRHDSWSKDNSNWSETSTLSSTTFKDGDIVYWDVNYGGAKCQSKITVVDKTKPTCASPSVTIESCSASIADVKDKFNSLILGTDNCGIQSYSIDEARTAYTTFTPAADGSDKTYKIYYTVTDINGLTNDGYCTATLTIKGKEADCPDAEMGMLSTNGSFSTTLPEEAEWKVESPSTVSVSGNTLTGKLPFNTMTEVKLSTEACGQKKECTTKIILIKSATPCTTK